MNAVLQWHDRLWLSPRATTRFRTLFLRATPVFFLLLWGIPLPAQAPAQSGLPPVLQQVDFRPQLGAGVPLDTPFADELGTENTRLGDYFAGKPIVLALVYYTCPTLCDEVLEGLATSLRVVSLRPGKDFQVVVVSFNPGESSSAAQAKKEDLLKQFPKSSIAEGWHFLTGGESSISALTRSVGFRYAFDPQTKTYAHASGILVLTPQGTISRYLSGIDFPARDLQFALIDASQGKIGSVVDHLLLFCYQYDPRTGRYGAAITRILQWSGIVCMAGLLALILAFLRQDKQRRLAGSGALTKDA